MKTGTGDPLSSAALQQQARVWLRLLTSTEVKQIDADGFGRWLPTSAAHQAACVEVKRRWDVLEPAGREFLRAHPGAAAEHRRAMQGPALGRRAFMGAAASAAVVAGVVLVQPDYGLWPAAGERGVDERTATGEQRAITLASKVEVTLNTQTRIRRQISGGQTTGLELLGGEAAIDLPAGGQAFTVIAGAGRSLAASGRFEVRHLADKVCVSCIEGTVRVAHAAGTRELQARKQTVYSAQSIGGIARIEPQTVSAWRAGALVFQEVRLSEVLDEINRYRPGRVVLLNAAARERRVSGRFLLASLDTALAQIQGMFGLQSRALPAGLYLLS